MKWGGPNELERFTATLQRVFPIRGSIRRQRAHPCRPRTPCGEYLRRFWHPVALASELEDLPLLIRVFGEDRVLFRDLSRRVGLLHRRCSHRLASLEFASIEERGIRCCLHGGLYDIDGTLLDAPAEPANTPLLKAVRQGAYPGHEYKGLIFAYLGPPDEKPVFPIYDTFEIPDDEIVPYACDFPCKSHEMKSGCDRRTLRLDETQPAIDLERSPHRR